MKTAMLGILFGAGLIWMVVTASAQPSASDDPLRSAAGRPSEQLISFTASAGEGRQQITVIDPKTRVMSVYHVEMRTGEVALKSVRNLTWDLQMVEFNTADPSPREIRSLIERQ